MLELDPVFSSQAPQQRKDSPVCRRVSRLNHRRRHRQVLGRAQIFAPGFRLGAVGDRKRVPELDERVAQRVEDCRQKSLVAVAADHRRRRRLHRRELDNNHVTG